MKVLVFLLAFVLNSQNEQDLINVKKILLFENDFFDVTKKQVNNYFLYKVHVSVAGGSSTNLGIEYLQKTCRCLLLDFQRNSNLGVNYTPKNLYYLNSTKQSYGKLSDWMTNDVYSFLEHSEVHKGFLMFKFYFIDKPTTGYICFDEYRNVQIYQTYRMPVKDSNNIIDLKYDGIELCIHFIKEMFRGFVYMKIQKLFDYNDFLNETSSELEEDLFTFYYFKNKVECLESLKEFIKELCFFNLVENDSKKCSNSILTEWEFLDCLSKKFENNFSELVVSNTFKTFKFLFDQTCEYLKDEMLQNNLLLLIGGKYNIDFYLDEMFQMILKSISQIQKKYNAINLEIEDSGLCDVIFILSNYLVQLQIAAIKDLCESEYVHTYFSKLFGKKIETVEDFIIIESIMCDYHNILAYTVTLYHRIVNSSFKLLPYFKPSSKNQFENYNFRIKTGIEIKFEYTTEFKRIVGFDQLGNRKVLEKDTDYFIDGYSLLNLVLEVLKMKNIIEIEVTSSENKKKRFNVKDYMDE